MINKKLLIAVVKEHPVLEEHLKNLTLSDQMCEEKMRFLKKQAEDLKKEQENSVHDCLDSVVDYLIEIGKIPKDKDRTTYVLGLDKDLGELYYEEVDSPVKFVDSLMSRLDSESNKNYKKPVEETKTDPVDELDTKIMAGFMSTLDALDPVINMVIERLDKIEQSIKDLKPQRHSEN